MKRKKRKIVNVPKPDLINRDDLIECLKKISLAASLKKNNGNHRAVAKELGISSGATYYLLKKYGIINEI